MTLRFRDYLGESGSGKVSPEVAKAIKPYLGLVKTQIMNWLKQKMNRTPKIPKDETLIQDVWNTAYYAGWKEEEILAEPKRAVQDVLDIWRNK